MPQLGETGVLRGLGLDSSRMELWLKLERDGARDKLRFALRATAGPRNGHLAGGYSSRPTLGGVRFSSRARDRTSILRPAE